jgi:hypothetical protein
MFNYPYRSPIHLMEDLTPSDVKYKRRNYFFNQTIRRRTEKWGDENKNILTLAVYREVYNFLKYKLMQAIHNWHSFATLRLNRFGCCVYTQQYMLHVLYMHSCTPDKIPISLIPDGPLAVTSLIGQFTLVV